MAAILPGWSGRFTVQRRLVQLAFLAQFVLLPLLDLFRFDLPAGKGKGSKDEQPYAKMKELLMKEIERHFSPEFTVRRDEVVGSRQLGREHLG